MSVIEGGGDPVTRSAALATPPETPILLPYAAGESHRAAVGHNMRHVMREVCFNFLRKYSLCWVSLSWWEMGMTQVRLAEAWASRNVRLFALLTSYLWIERTPVWFSVLDKGWWNMHAMISIVKPLPVSHSFFMFIFSFIQAISAIMLLRFL